MMYRNSRSGSGRAAAGALIAAAALFLSACSGPYHPAPQPAFRYVPPADTDVVEVSYAAAERLMDQVYEPLDRNRPVLVTSLADIDNLQQSSSLGRLIAEQIGSRISQIGFPVVEVKLRNSLAVNQQGEFALSRDVRMISAAHDAQAVVTGTYAAGKRDVYVSLRLIRMADARVIASFDYALPAGPNTKSLVNTAAAY